jgi:histidinol-phosphate aminotransferase
VSAAELAGYGLSPGDVLDFSVNTNPLGPSPGVLRCVLDTDWSRYPGDDEAPLRRALAHHTGLDANQVVLGNGSAELIWLLALAVLQAGDEVAVLGPTFGEYGRAAHVLGADLVEVASVDEVPAARVVFVCNPNNPTGAYRGQDELERLLRADAHRVIVLDEAYLAFVDGRWPSERLLARYSNVVLLRSLTKEHALPGLRLGYLLAAPQVAGAIEAVRPPWSVNAGALRAGLAALEPEAQAHLARAVDCVRVSRQRLTTGFERLGYRVWPSRANFVLVEVGDGAAFRRGLLSRGFVVRDCASFGLPRCIRVACRLPDECDRLLAQLA